MAVKLDSAFIKLCVCVKKSNFLSWAIRTVFVDPVTYIGTCSKSCKTGLTGYMVLAIIVLCIVNKFLCELFCYHYLKLLLASCRAR